MQLTYKALLEAVCQNVNLYVALSEQFPDAINNHSAFSSGSSSPQWMTQMMMMMIFFFLHSWDRALLM
jgi:hypothetical protein